jgi:hypothetical protein
MHGETPPQATLTPAPHRASTEPHQAAETQPPHRRSAAASPRGRSRPAVSPAHARPAHTRSSASACSCGSAREPAHPETPAPPLPENHSAPRRHVVPTQTASNSEPTARQQGSASCRQSTPSPAQVCRPSQTASIEPCAQSRLPPQRRSVLLRTQPHAPFA